ncbi:MAG TPA: CPBP family intramembrane glutamic endopeptidase [Anaerolineae bacterium]
MKPILFSLLLIALIIFLLLVLIQRKQIFAKPALLGLFFGVYFLDNLTITLTNHIPGLQIVPNYVWEGFLLYGWSGKLYSILLVVAFVFLVRPGLTKEDVGLTLRQNEGFLVPASLIVLALAAWALIVGMCSPKGQQDFRFLIYLAVMPGLNEELVYRGYELAILNRLMPPNFKLFAAPVGWGVIVTSMMFGLLHGVWLDNSLAVHLDVLALRNSAFSGLIFAWLRERTGSLLVPIIAHGLEDVLFFLPRMT